MTQPTALYRHFDAAGRLLYVGISLNAVVRLTQHRKAPWFGLAVSMTTEWHDTREAASEAERRAIRDERPLHNRQRYGAPPPRDAATPILPALKPNAPLQAYVDAWGVDAVQVAMGSSRRQRLIAEGKLKPLDYDKWASGGYGLDPFGIAGRDCFSVPLSPTPSN